ncbi:hypothetical protein CYJ57_05495 [Falseniella ignava]|uniref:Uncharacterized protein n=1 Tax=Falseniella ignava TaxID=137730 RepID=A0A2I1JYX5_9LACT|nr:hypothetical protein [Falseniella ignava]PKY88579.1 hypothetical protein CYJ57_05495 [Falseniella ignava]
MNRAIERAEHQLIQKSVMLADYCGLNPCIGAASACRDGLIINFLQLQVTVYLNHRYDYKLVWLPLGSHTDY